MHFSIKALLTVTWDFVVVVYFCKYGLLLKYICNDEIELKLYKTEIAVYNHELHFFFKKKKKSLVSRTVFVW